MKPKFLLTALFFITRLLIAQETFKPFVDFYGDNLVLDNFPAISEDGSHYLIEYSQYSCCISTEEKLQKISTKNGEVLDEIILYPGEEATEFIVKDLETAYKKVSKLLKSNNYSTLKKIPKFNHVNDSSNGFSLSFTFINEMYTSEQINLPRILSHGFCCGGEDLRENCLLYQSIIAVWFSKEHNFLLIESGINQAANGCDQGPFYQIVSVIKD
ncbi:hypothetical protein [Aquimarina litoralis]|uniref:hypothetical protein n=1 Tax=Aquimarina litoralis TaxID=584605 RepID=UPI001C575C7A|nr:hypothetical protein [Aquimarina litoralis]MBW1298160.1 hypothetical protein [Aquimarina litoralis]